MGSTERLLTAGEAAEWAKVSKATMAEWIGAGLLVTIPDGRRKLIRLTHLQKLMRDRLSSPGKRLPASTVSSRRT